jgi:putative sigma-54 modulation protein
MNIEIKSIHFTVDEKLRNYMMEKLTRLERFFERIIAVDVFLKLENSGQVRDKIVELKVSVPGNIILITETNKTFESAFDVANDNIKRQLKKHKEKMHVRG